MYGGKRKTLNLSTILYIKLGFLHAIFLGTSILIAILCFGYWFSGRYTMPHRKLSLNISFQTITNAQINLLLPQKSVV